MNSERSAIASSPADADTAQRLASARARLAELQSERERLEKEKLGRWSQCAQARAESLMRGNLSGPATRSDRRMRDRLARRRSRRAELRREIAAFEDNARAENDPAPALRQQAEQAHQRRETARTQYRARLANDGEYQRLVERQSRFEQALSGLAARLEYAIDERDRKSAAYIDDPLFRHLRNRGYATRAYRARGLGYRMDRWIADIADYEKAQRDYELLQDMPRWLEEVIDNTRTQKAQADAELDDYHDRQPESQRLRRLETDARDADAALASHSQSLENAAAEQRARRQELEAIEAGDDADTRAIRDSYRELFCHQPIAALMKLAEQTATGLDQAALQRIDEIDKRQARLDGLIAQITEDIGQLDDDGASSTPG